MPERLDLGDLGEEPVTADVEPPAVALHGSADSADDGVALEHHRGAIGLAELVGGGEARRAGSDHDDIG